MACSSFGGFHCESWLQDEMSSKRVDLYSSPDMLRRQQQLGQQDMPSVRASRQEECGLGDESARNHDLFNNMPAASGASYGARQPTDTSKISRPAKQGALFPLKRYLVCCFSMLLNKLVVLPSRMRA